MKHLPQDYWLLKQLKSLTDAYFYSAKLSTVLRSTDIYDFVRKYEPFNYKFPTQREFNQFLRRAHDKGFFRQVFKNSSVDTSDHFHYQWHFYPPAPQKQPASEGINDSRYFPTKNGIWPNTKVYEAANGIKVRSQQELLILNSLLELQQVAIYYEKPLTAGGETKYPDFTIANYKSKSVFHWEHFGMTEFETYSEGIAAKLEWYQKWGYMPHKEGGKLIVTIYKDQTSFIYNVREAIEYILSQ